MCRVGNHRLLRVMGTAVLAAGAVATAVAPTDAKTGQSDTHTGTVKNMCGTPKPGFECRFAQTRTDVHEPAHIGR